MELSANNQFLDAIGKAKNILVALPKDLTVDTMASGLALASYLEKQSKQVEIISAGVLPKNGSFLPGLFRIKPKLSAGSSLIINLNTEKNKLEELSYETEGNSVKIYLKSLPQALKPEDVSFETDGQKPDLVIILGAAALSDLGSVFENNAELFFQVPKINLDFKPANEYYGAINLIDINATSVAEILTALFENQDLNLIDEDIATCLLAGIISQTNSFQRVQTTPKVFLQASRLMALGGRQQEIIKHLYKTKSLPFLRLWGRALARLKLVENFGAMYSVLLSADFEKSQASVEDLSLVLRELMENIQGFRLVAVVAEETSELTRIVVAGHEQINKESLVKIFGAPVKQSSYGLSPFWVAEFIASDQTVQTAEEKLSQAISSL